MISEPENTEPQLPLGGSGGDTEYPLVSVIKEGRLEQRAINEGWPTADRKVKEAIVNRQSRIAIDPESTPREATSSFKALMECDKINAMLNPPAQQHDHRHVHATLTLDERTARIVGLINAELERRKRAEVAAGKLGELDGTGDGNGRPDPSA